MPTHERGADVLPLSRLIAWIQAALRRRAAVRAGLWAVAGALAALAAVLVADMAWGLSGARIIFYLAATAAGLMAVAGAAARAARPVPSAFYVARLIEKRRPDLKNALITFVELACEGAADRSLYAAVGRRAARLLAGTDPVEFLPAPALRRPLAAAGAAAIILARASGWPRAPSLRLGLRRPRQHQPMQGCHWWLVRQ